MFGVCGLLLLAACQSQPLVRHERPEPGLQGQTLPGEARILDMPYSQGVRVVGHDAIHGRDNNVQLSWVQHCAYVSSTGGPFPLIGAERADADLQGVAVIDVSNPRVPRTVQLLRGRGSLAALETMDATEATDRSVLAAGAYGGDDDNAWLDIYDLSDCTNPRHTAEYRWPENVHTVTLSRDGRRVYGADLDPFTGHGGIHVLDISDMENPRYIGKFGATLPDGASFEFATHEIEVSDDERRIYAGVLGSRGGDLNRDITTPEGTPTAARLGPNAGGVYILDNSDLVEGRPNPQMRLLGTVERGGWHSVMTANIDGVPHLVGGGELGACPGAWPKIINIADETRPFIVSEFRLAMNELENCPPRSAAEQASMGIMGDAGTASLHFNDVDSAVDTRLGLFQFMWAGLRIVDIRDPANPVEIAYFKPGDACGGHVRYVQDTGHIWLSCGQSGFYVLELADAVRARLREDR